MSWDVARAALVVALLFGPASSVEAQPNAAVEGFDRGRQLLAEGRHEEALAAFRRSHELLASPNSLLMAARALRALGRLAEARSEMRSAEREAAARQPSEPRYQATEAAAREEGAELDAQVGRLRILLEAPDGREVEIHVGERLLEPGAIDDVVYVEPGPVRITAVREGAIVARVELEARLGVEHEVALVVAPLAPVATPVEDPPVGGQLEAPSPTPVPAPRREVEERVERTVLAPIGWAALALGVASAAAFGGLYAATDAHYHDSVARCAMACSDALASDGRTLEALTNAFFVSTLVFVPLAVASLVIAQLDAGSVEVALGPAGARLRGRF